MLIALITKNASLLSLYVSRLLYCTEIMEVSLLLCLFTGFVEESDPCDDHGELFELLLLVPLQEHHECSQFSLREDALQSSWDTEKSQLQSIQPQALVQVIGHHFWFSFCVPVHPSGDEGV